MNENERRKLAGRRKFLALLAAGSAAALGDAAHAGSDRRALRIGLTPVFLDDQIGFIARWRRWLEERLEQPVAFVQRGNYREIVDLLLSGKLEFAWLCGYPYLRNRSQLQLVAVPLWQGQPLYRSYLIVANASPFQSLADLRGAIFAYSDPDSNSGFLYPQYAIQAMNENPASYFTRTFFTWAHRTVVEAVSVGLADGGAVDGYVWETLARTRPQLTEGTRVIDRSPLLGFPPFVARGDIAADEIRRFRTALMGMAADGRGAELLGNLGLDGFTAGDVQLFDGIARMMDRTRRP